MVTKKAPSWGSSFPIEKASGSNSFIPERPKLLFIYHAKRLGGSATLQNFNDCWKNLDGMTVAYLATQIAYSGFQRSLTGMRSKNQRLIRLQWNVVVSHLVLFAAILGASQTNATTYYMAPNGSDSNAGISSTSPWRTFNFALPRLSPGDMLVLRSGTYTASDSGLPIIDCSTTAKNGTASQPITIKAENERQAFISGNGAVDTLKIMNCSYWILDGLRVQSADFNGAVDGSGVRLIQSSNITVRRFLVAYNNRFSNSHLISVEHTRNSLFEENELYWFQRHGFLVYYSEYNTFRRNYINSRLYPNGGGRETDGRGDDSIALYPASNNLIENNISENNTVSTTVQATSNAINNRIFGSISINDLYGVVFKAREGGNMPQNNTVKDFVALSPTNVGVYFRGNKTSQCNNCTVIGGNNGYLTDVESGYPGDGIYSVSFQNSLVLNAKSYGFFALTDSGTWTGSVNSSDAYNSGTNFSLGSLTSTKITTANPQLGSCIAWVPAGSAMKGAGVSGADIGANIIYQYQNGVLTTNPLWHTSTGEFPHGAIVPGLNDIAGSSAFDVHKRLNVNTNGCPFPSGYAYGNTAPAPRNLIVTK